MIQLPTIEYLRECFDLREDGALIWKTRPRSHFPTNRSCSVWNLRFPGTEAGCVGQGPKYGYRLIRISHRTLSAHRIVWAMVTGAWPIDEIDHIDGNRANNRPSNLREATSAEQMQNMKRFKNNTSGFPGVHLGGRKNNRWRAQIEINGNNIFLGSFDTPEEAYEAYLTAKRTLHPFQPKPRVS